MQALQQGAYDYITKPFANDHLKSRGAQRARRTRRCSRKTASCAASCARSTASRTSSAKATPSSQVFRIMEKVARTDSSVLITGESGTGKELVARAIHFTSERANGRFLPINCGALPENLLESELFGYKRGAFTGAVQDKIGLLKAADKGTMFLDEIGDMPLALQVKLLRALQERECLSARLQRPGALRRARAVRDQPRPRSARSTRAASARSCSTASTSSRSQLPPLRERKDDIPLLANHFLRKYEKLARRGGDALFQGRDARAARLRVAGQRARAGKHHRARRHPGRDRRHPRSRPARQAAHKRDCHRRRRGDDSGTDAGGARARAHQARAEPRSRATRSAPREVLGIHLSTLYRKVQRYRLENVGVR